MGEFVKKTVMGYKEASGGLSDPECTHVILTEREYRDLLRQISDAQQEARTTRIDAQREIMEAQRRATEMSRRPPGRGRRWRPLWRPNGLRVPTSGL